MMQGNGIQHKLSTKKGSTPMRTTRSPEIPAVPAGPSNASGEGGIRTRGTVLPVRRFSKAVPTIPAV